MRASNCRSSDHATRAAATSRLAPAMPKAARNRRVRSVMGGSGQGARSTSL